MVSIKEAVESAVAFAQATLGEERTKGMRLEEVDTTTTAGQEAWLITLSMAVPAADLGPFAADLLTAGRRAYKTFTVRKRDGDVTSMKIRELADA
jgi:hypothetical protein